MYLLVNAVMQKYAAFGESFFQSEPDTSRVCQQTYKQNNVNLILIFSPHIQ